VLTSPSPSIIAPRQRRSEATLHRLLDAAEILLSERSLEDTSVAEIAARANSSVGSFYARFPTKDDLCVALLERYHQDVARSLGTVTNDRSWDDLDLESRARLVVSEVISFCRRRRGLLRLRLQRRLSTTGPDPTVADEPHHDEHTVAGLAQLFESCKPEIRRPDPNAALRFALRLIDSTATASIAIDDVLKSYGVVDDTALVDELTVAFIAYLKAD
jgi:AcrR family transcriptional regulator